jgi:hypothetical protein
VDGPVTNFVVLANPLHGTLSGVAPNLTYTPATNYFGPDSLAFSVNDGSLTSAVATVSLTLTNVNDAPTAHPDALTRWMSQGVTTLTANLLTNDVDVDGDTLSLLSVTNPLPAGAWIISSNSSATYWPASGDTNACSFNYIITDDHGGYATGLVAVAAVPDPAGSDVLSLTAEPGATVNVILTGVPGFTYTIQFTDYICDPQWQNLTVTKANGSGELNASDTMPPGSPRRFYRAVRGIAP